MATYDKTGQMTYVDESGNEHLLYPNTKMECVEGLEAQLASKAPAGFGLGEHIAHHSADGVLEFFDEQLATMPNGTKKFIEFAGDYQTTRGAMFVGELCKRDNNYAYVIGYTYSDAMGLYRAKYGGVWNPWEYINPPMVVGEEYRTTERYMGKPVYVRAVDCGNIPNATSKTITYGEENCMAIFVYGATNYVGTVPSMNVGAAMGLGFNSDQVISLWGNRNTISIACGGDRSSASIVCVVKYYKTTD